MGRLTEQRGVISCGLAFASEGAALALALRGSWLDALALHTAAAALLALSSGGERVQAKLAVSVGLWAWCVPVLAPVGISVVLLPALARLRRTRIDGVIELELREPNLTPLAAAANMPVAEVLQSPASDAERIAAVLSLRRLPAASAVPLLRTALLDTCEDVRLLAYALLERREKKLRADIEANLRQLDRSRAERVRAALLETLCEQHWELVQGGFLSRAVERVTLETATRYGEESLAMRLSGSLALSLARIRLRAVDNAGALTHLNAAFTAGVARSVVAPVYARAAFGLQRYEALAPLLFVSSAAALAQPENAALSDFWSGADQP
jgi:hypothetical protein